MLKGSVYSMEEKAALLTKWRKLAVKFLFACGITQVDDLDDLLQEVAIRVMRRPIYRDGCFTGVMRYACLEAAREHKGTRRKHKSPVMLTDRFLFDVVGEPMDECLDFVTALEALQKVDGRPGEYLKRWVDGETFREIAASEGLSESRVAQLVWKGQETARGYAGIAA